MSTLYHPIHSIIETQTQLAQFKISIDEESHSVTDTLLSVELLDNDLAILIDEREDEIVYAIVHLHYLSFDKEEKSGYIYTYNYFNSDVFSFSRKMKNVS